MLIKFKDKTVIFQKFRIKYSSKPKIVIWVGPLKEKFVTN